MPDPVMPPETDGLADDPKVIPGTEFMRWKTVRERAAAEREKLALAREVGKVIDAGEAVKAFTAAGRIHAKSRDSVPTQLAPKLVGLTDVREIEKLIRAEFREADRRAADEIERRFAEMVRDRDVVSNATGS